MNGSLLNLSVFHNPELGPDDPLLQAVLFLHVRRTSEARTSPLALAVVLDRSASMNIPMMEAAKDAAIRVVQMADEHIVLVVITFSQEAQVLAGPFPCTTINKKTAIRAIKEIKASGGTCMSQALNLAARHLSRYQTHIRRILFLTDGRNDGEKHTFLEKAVETCRAARIEITAWGLGSAWDEKELRFISGETGGQADAVLDAHKLASAFARSFQAMQKVAAVDLRLQVSLHEGCVVRSVRQVYPYIVRIEHVDRQHGKAGALAALGSVVHGDHRAWLLEVAVPYHLRDGREVFSASLDWRAPEGSDVYRTQAEHGAWAKTGPRSIVDPRVAHYLYQEELANVTEEGRLALSQGDVDRAGQLLGRALRMSKESRNEPMARLLSSLLQARADGTIILTPGGGTEGDRKSLGLHLGRTSLHDPDLESGKD